ncbi:MAG TPA: alkaline phosphatase family protein [Syntrophales bacterium]|nr:alkaline phosphatase family protein [Syntrophales bacterium]
MSKWAGDALSQAVREGYRAGREDETLEPLVLVDGRGTPVGRFRNGDAVIFYNIRGEREIELTRSLTEPGFPEFPVHPDLALHFATMIRYREDLKAAVAFPPDAVVADTLSETIARHGLKQIKITEAEKAVHVGFFLNGKRDEPFDGETRHIVPTRKDVALFDEAPEMSIAAVAEAVLDAIRDDAYAFIFANFPNVDVVGHIENEAAILRAVEAVDRNLGRVVEAATRAGLTVVVSADHGTVEKWLYPDGTIDTGHTDSPVPFLLLDNDGPAPLRPSGELTDIAPTVLERMGLPVPAAMTGRSLLAGPRSGRKPARRLLLLVLDGWGHAPDGPGNLISRAQTPNMDRLRQTCPPALLAAAGEAVGLPEGTVGNSEAGHLHIGAGRRIYADRVRIDRAIADGSFYSNPAFLGAVRAARDAGTALHLMGIVSFFSSHGSLRHLFALMDLARREGVRNVFIHAMLGRRGEKPESGANYIQEIETKCLADGLGRVVSVIGRYWSMDREENWDRIEKTYRMLVYGEGAPVAERG